jgi:hypothetical protein
MGLEIIDREVPVTEKESSRKSLYSLRDEMFRFWYNFIFPESTLIETGMGDYLLNKRIMPELSNYIGKTFEKVCADFVKRKNANGEFKVRFRKIGRWWGNNPHKKKQEEIDIVGLNDEVMLFGECKWRNQKVGTAELNKLIEKSGMFSAREKMYILFSKSGFSKELYDISNNDSSLMLFSLEELFE